MLTLTPIQRRSLRAQAHALNPVVMIGQHGMTPAVLREIDRALNTHELIKVRIFNDDRSEREAIQLAICTHLGCAPVQHVGKLIILWRPAPPKKAASPQPAKRPAKKAAVKTAKKTVLPGAINRHGQAIKPLSAQQARQLRHADEMPFADTASTHRYPPRPAGRHSRNNRGQTTIISQPPKPQAKQPRSALSQPATPGRPPSRRRLGYK